MFFGIELILLTGTFLVFANEVDKLFYWLTVFELAV